MFHKTLEKNAKFLGVFLMLKIIFQSVELIYDVMYTQFRIKKGLPIKY